MIEEWKDIPEFLGFYQVSNLGRIRSLDRIAPWKSKIGTPHYRKKKGKILSAGKFTYLQVNLSVENSQHMRYVHRLVAQAWLINPNNYNEVDHINGNKYDNTIENLRWVNHKDNIDAAYDNFQHKHGEHSCKAKITQVEMFKIIDLYKTTDLSQNDIAKLYGISQTQVGNIVRGDSWKRIIEDNKNKDEL